MSKIVQFKDKTTGEEIFPNVAIDSSVADELVTKSYLKSQLFNCLIRVDGGDDVMQYGLSKRYGDPDMSMYNSCIFFNRYQYPFKSDFNVLADRIKAIEENIKKLDSSNN